MALQHGLLLLLILANAIHGQQQQLMEYMERRLAVLEVRRWGQIGKLHVFDWAYSLQFRLAAMDISTEVALALIEEIINLTGKLT